MTNLKNIVAINMGILLLYMVAIRYSVGTDDGLGIALIGAAAIAFHVFTNVVLSVLWFSSKRKDLGKSYLLSAGIVLLVGFSACLGSSSL